MNSRRAGRMPILLGMMKNELPYVLEWVAHHRILGFERIIIVTNDNTDGTEQVVSALQQAGIVETIVHSVPAEHTPRGQASKLVVAKLRQEGYEGFIAHIDADEFLVLNRDDSLDSFLSRFEPGTSISVNWKIFGSNGHGKRPKGLVMENYDRCAPDDFEANLDYKTITWFADDLLAFDGHNAIFDGSRERLHAFSDGTPFQREKLSADYSRATRVTFEFAALNHYIIKSVEEYRSKVARGRIVDRRGRANLKPRYTKGFFPRFDRNEWPGNITADHLGRVKREMERLYQLAGLDRRFERTELGLPVHCVEA